MGTWKQGTKRRAGNGRATKYNNHRIKTVHGWFDSKGELQRWLYLLDAEKRGVIDDLKRQVPFKLEVNNILICEYVADFTYRKPGPGGYVVEDFKGMITDVFRLKAKLFKAVNGFNIKVVKGPTEDPLQG
jgi:hypothetical protein